MGSIANESGAVNFVDGINCHENKIKMDKLSSSLSNKVSTMENHEKLKCEATLHCHTLEPDMIKVNEKYIADLDNNAYPCSSNIETLKDAHVNESPVSYNENAGENTIQILQNTCKESNKRDTTQQLSPISVNLIEEDALIISSERDIYDNQLLNMNLNKSKEPSIKEISHHQNKTLTKDGIADKKVLNLCDTNNDIDDNECMICGEMDDIISSTKTPLEDNNENSNSQVDITLKMKNSCSHIVCKQCREDYILRDPNDDAVGNTLKCPFCPEDQQTTT